MRLSGRPRASRLSAMTVMSLVALLGIGLIGLSPLALRFFHGATVQWERLSFIGQTYGAASAVISVLALAGVVVTLNYQARETKRAREETRRQAISDLLRMAMNDPDLDECWGPVPAPDDPKSRKQLLYTNMIIAAWAMSYETGATPEQRLTTPTNSSADQWAGSTGGTLVRAGSLHPRTGANDASTKSSTRSIGESRTPRHCVPRPLASPAPRARMGVD